MLLNSIKLSNQSPTQQTVQYHHDWWVIGICETHSSVSDSQRSWWQHENSWYLKFHIWNRARMFRCYNRSVLTKWHFYAYKSIYFVYTINEMNDFVRFCDNGRFKMLVSCWTVSIVWVYLICSNQCYVFVSIPVFSWPVVKILTNFASSVGIFSRWPCE